jgi:hypothetical protein
MDALRPSRERWGSDGQFFWGFASQGASSATNLGLSLLAGIFLGPQGLGIIFLGFAAYLVALGFQRALITDPLVSTTSSSEPVERRGDSRAGLSATLVWACGVSASLAVIGLAIGGDTGWGLVVFAPWVAPALIQDYWRTVLFRDGRGRSGAINDGAWALGMGLAAPIAILHPQEWTIIGCWGFGAFFAMLVGFRQTLLSPQMPGPSLRWWKSKGWPLGRWLAAEAIVYTVGTQAIVFLILPIVGTGALGGLRAVQTIFAPLSLLGPALALPAFPYIARAVSRSIADAHNYSIRLGIKAAVLTGAYLVTAASVGTSLLVWVFGPPFEEFSSLIWPVGIGQILVAGTLGVSILMKAEGRGRVLLASRAVGSLSSLASAIGLAIPFGIEGAAWGMTLGTGLGAVSLLALARRRSLADAFVGSAPGSNETRGDRPLAPPSSGRRPSHPTHS